MKTIGMLGGMSWESSAVYYRILNREVQTRLGGVHSAKTLMYSFDFAEMSVLQHSGRMAEANDLMATVAVHLAKSGADFLMICCNTMHIASAQMEQAARIPLLHIADPLGAAITQAGSRVPRCWVPNSPWSGTTSFAAVSNRVSASMSSRPKARMRPK
jgi:aspartate racemase